MARATAETRTLDIAENQMLVTYEDDDPKHHHRVLFFRVENGKWIGASPHYKVHVVDVLAEEGVIPLARASDFPVPFGDVLTFRLFDQQRFDRLRAEARRLAIITGGDLEGPGRAAVSDAKWYYSDTAHGKFGKEIPSTLIKQAGTLVSGSSVIIPDDDDTTHGQLVGGADVEKWLEEKRVGVGRDVRLARPVRSGEVSTAPTLAARMMTFEEALLLLSPLPGPRNLKEVLQAVRMSGMELKAHAAHYLYISGVSEKSGIAIEFLLLFNYLSLMNSYDLLSPLNSASAELIARRALQIQKAIKRNPRAPDFEGLDHYLIGALDSGGGAAALSFDKFVADKQRDEGQMMKQSRLLREEGENDAKRKNNNRKKKGGEKKEGDE